MGWSPVSDNWWMTHGPSRPESEEPRKGKTRVRDSVEGTGRVKSGEERGDRVDCPLRRPLQFSGAGGLASQTCVSRTDVPRHPFPPEGQMLLVFMGTHHEPVRRSRRGDHI